MATRANGMRQSTLGSQGFRPTWELVLSLFGHMVVGSGIVLGERCTPSPEPLIDLDDVMMVQAVALPKPEGRMPDKPMHTVDPVQGTPESAKQPPPPTASEMVIHKEDEKPKGEKEPPRDRSKEREALMRDAQREAALKDLSTAVGPRDQSATDPNGVDPSEAIFGTGGAGPTDPELARYIAECRSAIVPNWTPLPTTLKSHPEFDVIIGVAVKADGSLGTPKVLRGTGDASFDRSALLAVMKTGRLPPPPAKYRDSAARGVTITLAARDKR